MGNISDKKYVAVLVHADMWGAYNANKLLKAVKEQGAEPVLIVTRSTPGKDGKPATKLEDLKLPRVLKEEVMLDYFKELDAMGASGDLMTFNVLSKRYCGRDEAYMTTSGGKKGGQEILEIFKTLESEGKKPEVVLSGDTLALLPSEITDGYDCFGTHPGPLPEIRGMQGTGRSLINKVFYDRDEHRLPPDYPLGIGAAYVRGSFFNLATKLDEGPVIETSHSFVCPGMCLLQVRNELYDMLTDVIVKHLPELLDATKRKALLSGAKKRAEASAAEPHDDIPELEEYQLKRWLGDGTGYVVPGEQGRPDDLDIIHNKIIDTHALYARMRAFYPGDEAGFEKLFEEKFKPGMDELEPKQRDYMNADMKFMYALRDVARGDAKMKVKRSTGSNPDGSIYPIIERKITYKKQPGDGKKKGEENTR